MIGGKEEASDLDDDTDHEKLVGLIDELRLMLLSSRDNSSAMGEMLDEVATLATCEFSREEALMRSTRAPDREAHTRLHREMARQLDHLQRRFEYEPDAVERTELYDWISDWLVHVLSQDASARGADQPGG